MTVLGDSANGTEVDDGWLTIGCGCLVAALLLVAYVRRKAGVALRVALVLPALLASRVTIADIYDVNTTAAGVFPAGAASVGWGLALAAAGALAALAIGVGALIGRPVSLFEALPTHGDSGARAIAPPTPPQTPERPADA